MTFNQGQGRRPRSSTTASRGLNADEQASAAAYLVGELVAHIPFDTEQGLQSTANAAKELLTDLTGIAVSKDIFRRAKGFENIFFLLRHICFDVTQKEQSHAKLPHEEDLIRQCLSLLGEAFRGHYGNERYFCNRVDGWPTMQKLLDAYYERTCSIQAAGDGEFEPLRGLFLSLLELAVGVEIYQRIVKHDAEAADPEDSLVFNALQGNETFSQPQAAAILVTLAIRDFEQKMSNGSQRSVSVAGALVRLIADLTALSVRNQIALWQTGMLSTLLRTALESKTTPEVRMLIQPLIDSMKDLGLTNLDDVELLYRRAYETEDARDTLLSFLRRSKGPAYVHFDLSQYGYCSVELPSLPRTFPPSTGYTLTAWVRVDHFDPGSHTTIFGAFDSTQTCFILAYLEQDSHQLILQTSMRSSRPSVRFKSTRFQADRWYHIGLVHKRGTTDPQQSPAMLFVDGEFAEQIKVPYPETPREIEEKSASPSRPPTRRAPPVQAFFGTPHDLSLRLGRNKVFSKWSLASAHLYSSPLTDEFLSVHHRLGERYSGNLQDCLGPLLTYRASAELNRYNELLHPDKSEKSDILTATEGRGSDVVQETKLLFSFSPGAIITVDGSGMTSGLSKGDLGRKSMARCQQLLQKTKAIAINLAAPAVNEAISRSHGVAVLTGDPMVALRRSLDDASWCMAGCLPVLTRLLESANTKRGFLQAVEIFFECVKDSWRISEAMEKGNGFGILALIIREKIGLESGASGASLATRKASQMLPLEDRQSLPLELLQLILGSVGYVKDSPEDSMIVNPMAYRVLLIDFDTWRRCDSETQRLYYSQFVHFVLRNKHSAFNHKRLTRMRVIKRLVEAMKTEDIQQEAVTPLMQTLRALLENSGAQNAYRDLANFVVFGLQDEKAVQQKPLRNMASMVKLRQRAVSWARGARSSRPNTPGGLPQSQPKPGVPRSELAVEALTLLANTLCDDRSPILTRRFIRIVPIRWMLHLLSESDARVVTLATQIICRCLYTLGPEFKHPFMDKDGGLVTMKARLKAFWKEPALWTLCFAMMFARNVPAARSEQAISVMTLVEDLQVDDSLKFIYPDLLVIFMAMLEAGLREVVEKENPAESDVKLVTTIIQFLSELYARSAGFRDFAVSSRYVQELLFVLYPVIVGSDRLAAETEYQAEKDTLSFKGEEVVMRPHSNSTGERPPSVRSLNMDADQKTPSPRAPKRIAAPRRLSSFILVNDAKNNKRTTPSTRFNAAIAPKNTEPVKLNVGNSIVESLLEVCISLFIDQVCTKKDFNGLGLFLKVPPGFREHQAYFESYVLVHALSQLWNHLQLNQSLLRETKVLTNLGRYTLHMAEAVFEGWFINGAQPVMEMIGPCLDFLQQPQVSADKNVRLCAQAINTMRIVFLRVTLLRLSELDEIEEEAEAIMLLNQMNYWQTILFSTENQETPFIRLICFLLYMKLTSSVQSVRLAAARLWRTMLVQKPTETATLLTYAMGSTQRHLSTGFMKLTSLDDEEFIQWVDENRSSLDTVFVDALAKPWEDFVNEENRRNEESARLRLNKRREKLRQWQTEETAADDILHRYEISTSHWRSNSHSQERMKLQRSLQDHQENVNHLFAVFTRLDKQMRQPGGLEASTEAPKWKLDETEAINRMRMRTLPDLEVQKNAYQPKRKFSERHANGRLAINTQTSRNVSNGAMASFPNTPIAESPIGTVEDSEAPRPRSESVSNSQLLEGGFELVDDPNQDEDGVVEDKNRKVMTSLQRGDQVQQLYNISRVEGLEACEGLLVIGKKCLYLQDSFFQRSDGEIVSVSQAPEDERDPYVQLISGKDIGTQRPKHNTGDQITRHWTWTEVLSISKRRFLFRDVSLEVFFADGRSYLLTCMKTKVRDDLYNAIVGRAPHVHSATTVASEDAWRLDNLRNPEETPQSLGSRFTSVFSGAAANAATKKWARGEMSNFQYLMLINTMAGRSFNDLTQYPVFPWVLADYSSPELDLDDPKTFRNFAKPMGCQTPAREAEFKDRYKQFAEMADENAPAFNYGTHYSSAMIVSSYLIRLQPFVQSYLLLQGGNFDHADRLFDSIEKAWLSASKDNMSDVRELTPEFYYLPEFLVNANKYDFGVKQGDGQAVEDVKLPAWAKGDPQLFVAKHREALESRYVSEHLHQWIDLVFGHKQRGEAAVEATNVFQHLSYGGAKDLDTIDDPVERLATIGIIHSFGQTPHQIFQKTHPVREVEKFSTSRLDTLAESLVRLPSSLFQSDEKVAALTFSPTQERLLCSGPCKLNMLPNCDRFLQWGFADHSIRFFSGNTKRMLGLFENVHVGSVSTATFADSKTLVTAGVDSTIAIWTVSTSRDAIDIQPKIYMFGHRAPVTILTASRVFSTLLSVSSDGQVLLWDLNRHECIRVLLPAGGGPIQAAKISNVSGHILICRGASVMLFTINGHLLVEQRVCESLDDRMTCCAFYDGAGNEWLERELIFTGHGHGVANVWALTSLSDGAWHLQLIHRLNHVDSSREDGGNGSAAVTAILPMANSVYTGDEDGKVWEWNALQRQSSFGGRSR